MLSACSQAWASWKTAPGVALLAVVAFAVGIGSTTAIFTVINGVLLRPLPYPSSDRFVSLYGVNTTDPGPFMAMSVPELHDDQQQTTTFDVFGWFRAGRFSMTAPGEPQLVPGAAVTPALARQLGPPLLGQWFADDSSAVISSALWRRLGGGRDILGSAITIDNRRYTVSGVMPPAFRLPIASLGMGRGDAAVWIPLEPSPRDATRSSSQYFAYARRKPGVSLEQARADVRRVAAAGVRLAVPLRTRRREILGVLLAGERSHRSGFSALERQVLRAGADQFALMIENARLTDRVVEQETLRRDIALASEVQRRLLPEAPPRAESVEFAAASLPARRIGGDYYDFVELRDREIGIALADVSGKGVAAALIMSVVQASLQIIASEADVSPPRLVARMNEFVYRSTPASKYATFFYAQLNQQRRQLRYVNAGHNAPYLLRAPGRSTTGAAPPEIEQLSVGGTVVGMFPEMSYEEATVELGSGDVLLVFTDGVPEAHNPEHEEFGEERLQQLLRQTAHLPADEIGARLSVAMHDWIRDAEQYDDLTFIVMKVR
ncbi:MAG: SpoIIE family protein phosphatase [Acidobacteriota bacterium]